jgi:formamidopyrimidine-DNA glycosylase
MFWGIILLITIFNVLALFSKIAKWFWIELMRCIMPELPEVETITRGLAAHLNGNCFTEIKTFIAAIRYPLELAGRDDLLQHRIVAVRRRGRYIIIELENLMALVIHLGMSGNIRIVPETDLKRKHDHVFFCLPGGITMRYECPRRFGFIKVCKLSSAGVCPQMLESLGLEPLDPKFNGSYLKKALNKRTMKIKTAIMDNRIVVGVGNIYAAESLYRSKISPLRPAGLLTTKECGTLVSNIKTVLTEAISAGGTTISDYKHLDGSEGKFVQQLQIYGKAGQPCPCCSSIIERVVIGGRSSCYCPKCQK